MCWGYNDSKQWIQDNVYMHKYHVHHHKETTHTALELVKSEVHLIPSKAMYTDYTATISTLWPSLLVGHTNFTFPKKESIDCMQPIIKKKHPQHNRNKNSSYIQIKHIFAVKDVITGLHFGNHKTNRTSVTIKIKTCIWSLIKHTNMHTLTVSEITLTFFSTSHKSHNDKKEPQTGEAGCTSEAKKLYAYHFSTQ